MHNYSFLIAKKKSQVQGLKDQIKKEQKEGKKASSSIQRFFFFPAGVQKTCCDMN